MLSTGAPNPNITETLRQRQIFDPKDVNIMAVLQQYCIKYRVATLDIGQGSAMSLLPTSPDRISTPEHFSGSRSRTLLKIGSQSRPKTPAGVPMSFGSFSILCF